MKNVSAAFKTMLQTSDCLLKCNLYTITLSDNTVYYYTDAQVNIVYNGHTYLAAQEGNNVPGFHRGAIKLAIGLQVESVEVDMMYDSSTVFKGTTLPAFANAGGFDGARMQIDKLLTPDFSDTSRGVVNMFIGVISDLQIGSGKVALTVSCDLIYLNSVFPRNYFLSQCNHALFDAGCTLLKSSFAVNASVTSATSISISSSALTQADGYFALGTILFTSGANAGIKRYIKSFSGGTASILYPLPATPAAGDTFTIYPGCDKTESTCINKFNNKPHFRGFPFVPTPEVIELGQAGSPPGDHSGGGAGMGGGGGGGIGRGPGGLSTTFKVE